MISFSVIYLHSRSSYTYVETLSVQCALVFQQPFLVLHSSRFFAYTSSFLYFILPPFFRSVQYSTDIDLRCDICRR